MAYISAKATRAEVYQESVEIVETLLQLGYEVKFTSYGQYKVFKMFGRARRKVEIFVGFNDNDKTFLYFGIHQGVAPEAFLPVGKRDFMGVELAIPADPEAVCAATYGDGWRTPNPDFRYELSKETWRPFFFLRATHNRGHWDAYYSRKKPNEPWSMNPSPFATSVTDFIGPGRLLEIGCGNGRDSLYFASRGFDVTGADYSPPAVELCAERAAEAGLDAKFQQLNIYDVVDIARFGAANTQAFDYLYARFFVHAITEQGEEDLLRVCQAVLKPGGKCFFEFRTNHDLRAQAGREISANEREDGHYRRFVDPDILIGRAAAHGLSLVSRHEGHGLAAFKDEDPHVARLVLMREAS
jgi:SAM-dependent methyltransferase